ncbi:hypothetical protein ACF1AY_35590 [Streptomyces sp. NPDC014776]|uniref:hypothetical protein n=1 Tax=unclassified Streptomyces TaxID=2593676 RepID=UPI0036F6A3BF
MDAMTASTILAAQCTVRGLPIRNLRDSALVVTSSVQQGVDGISTEQFGHCLAEFGSETRTHGEEPATAAARIASASGLPRRPSRSAAKEAQAVQ